MTRVRLATMAPLLGGIVTTAFLIVVFLSISQGILDRMIEPVRDAVLRAASAFVKGPAVAPRVVVVDIDAKSLDAVALWPWPRETVANLVEAIAATGPTVVAIDVLFENADTHSPAALARQLGARLDRKDLTALAATLPDGDKRLSAALRSTAGVLGFVLDPSTRGSIPASPIIARGHADLPEIWRGAGVIGPPDDLVNAAQGLGALALLGDANGIVRRVPLLVAADGRPYPGLALEAVRVAAGASTYIIDGASETIQVGELKFPLARDAMLRLAPAATKGRTVTISAADVLSGRFDPALQLMRGYVPHAPASAFAVQLASLLVAALLALLAALWLRPLVAALSVAVLVALIWLACIALAARPELLIDPLLPSMMAFAVFSAVLLLDFAITQRREARVRQRFEQHLAPQVVSLIVADPNLVKLAGERREITALFTDIEGFTTMTDRLGPRELVSILDRYFEGVAAIVMKHGGMIDKLVGDAVHAFFNAPLDQAEHWRHAIACGIEIRDWTEAFRNRPENRAAAMGKTRIGIETGDAVVGDVGFAKKLDYTAHGNAINTAARLEAANKDLGSTICIGAGAAARFGVDNLAPLGKVALRGLNVDMDVYTPKA
jgi:adenylate cyclase